MTKKLKVGCLYLIESLDHSVGIEKGYGITIYATGFFLGESKDFYKFSSWIVETDDKDIREVNYEVFDIIKSALKRVKKLPTFTGTKPIFKE